MVAIATNMRPVHTRLWTCFMSALCLLLAACGSVGANATAPRGWTDITPPDSGQIALYTVSPDIPGLIMATIGGHDQSSADPLPAARLWRSQDGGASWQSLNNLSVNSGAQLIMPPGGRGLVFAENLPNAPIWVSLDAGTAWRQAPTSNTSDDGADNEWTWLSGAVAIGGRLYAGGVAPGYGGMIMGTSRFAVSDDHGFTWRAIEASADPAGATTTTKAIAPLDATGSAWLRIVTVGEENPDTYPNRVALERSSDGGVTWTIVVASLTPGTGMITGRLASNPAHPGAVCMSLTTYDSANVTTPPTVTPFDTAASTDSSSQGGDAHSPPPPHNDVSLLASDDGGKTWQGGVVLALRRTYGGAMSPGVQMDADGSCYLATTQYNSATFALPGQIAALWRLSPGATTASSVWTITGRGVQSLALAPAGSGASARVIALTRISGPGDGQQISCGSGCYTTRDVGIYRLIWQPLPTV